MAKEISIFTATYNREHTLERLYLSLIKQTDNSFEWIIVDDGSTDNTKILIEEWLRAGDINIIYTYQPNSGKHKAINKGLEIAQGRLFFIVDSDDYLVDNAIERILFWEKTIKNDYNFAGIAALKGYKKNELIGKTFNAKQYLDCTSLERTKFNIIGDKAEIFYLEIFQNYRFPEFENENFISEAVVWNKIAKDGYKIRWFNEILYISEEYRSDGLTAQGNKKFLDNWEGYSYYVQHELKMRKNLLRRLNLLLIYCHLSKIKKQSYNVTAKKLKLSSKIVLLLSITCGPYYRLINKFK